METKGRESGSVKLKKPSFPLQPHPISTIPRRRSLGPTAIPVPSSHDNYRQIPNKLKPTKSLNNDTSSKLHSRKLQSTTTTTTTNESTHKHALARRRSFDKPPSSSQLPKPLTNPNPREQKPQSSSSFKARTTSSLQRPTKEKQSKPSSTLPKLGPEKLSKVTSTSTKSAADRSSKPSNKDIEKPHSLNILSKNGRKSTSITTTTTTTSRVKQTNTTSTNGSVRRARNTSDEFSQMVKDSKLKLQPQDQDPFIVHSGNEMANVDELPVEILILENKGDLDLVLDDRLLNQQEDDQVNPTMLDYQNPPPIIPIDESEEHEFHEAHFSEANYKNEQGGDIYSKKLKDKENMSYQPETIPNEAIGNNEQKKELESGETSSDENIKYEAMEEKGTVVDDGIKKDKQNSKETEEVKLEKENLHVLAMRQGKKDSPAYNDVIEETANRLREQRKNKVRALVGAFETVISLEDPMGETSLPK